MKATFSRSNTKKPAPKFYRKFENAMIIVIIPAIVATLQGWGFADDTKGTRLTLLIGTMLAAVIKGIGMMLANGEDYIEPQKEENES